MSLHLLLKIARLKATFVSHGNEIVTMSSAPVAALLSTLPKSSCYFVVVVVDIC